MGRRAQSTLVKLEGSDFVLGDRDQDLRGLVVYDRDGKEIGTIEGLFVDEEARNVRFLDVGTGGSLGVGEKHFMIPVEAVTHIGGEGVIIDQGRQKVIDAPALPTNVVPEADYQRGVYDYYGYEYPT